MALRKTELPISFQNGLSTKIDDKQQVVGSFSGLENVVFDSIKSFKKRSGYDKIDLTEITNQTVTTATMLSKFKQELIVHSDTNMYSYASNIERFIEKGSLFNVFPESKIIHKDNHSQSNIDCITVNGVSVFAYDDSVNGVSVTIIDQATGVVLLNNALVSVTGSRPKLGNIQNTVYISYTDGVNLRYKRVNILFPNVLSSEATLISNLDAVKKFDTLSLNDKIIYAYQSSNAGGELTFFSLNSVNATSSTFGVAGNSASIAVNIMADSMSRVICTYYNGTDVKFLIREEPLSVNYLAPVTVETIAAVTNVVCLETDVAQGRYNLYYEVSAAQTYNYKIRGRQVNNLGSFTSAASNRYLGVGIASKMFMEEDNHYFVGVHDSELQATYFLCQPATTGRVVARFSPGIAGRVIADNGPCRISALGDKRYLVGSQIKGKTVTDFSTFFSLLGVNQTIFDFDVEDNLNSAVLGDNLHISAGFLYMYDGRRVVEHGFHLYPENLTAGTNAAFGGSMSNGTYQYAAVYMWTDKFGQEHRSAPSIGLSVITTAGGSGQTQQVIVPTLRLTDKLDVAIELYRTETLGDVFYRVTSTTSPTYNSTVVSTVTVTDTISDTDLVSREILYTTGGILDNFTSPASSIIESFGNRLVLAGLEDPNKIQYSKIRTQGQPVEFNDNLIININPLGGDIKALFAYDDKLLIFKNQSIYFISGDGPNNAGQQDNFTEPELVSADVGCVDRYSTILTPDGVMFKSRKGIYLLDRGLALTYIGAPVEIFNDYKISSSDIIAKNNQVIFVTDNKIALVYDYLMKQWTTFTNHGGYASTVIDTDYYYLRTDRTLFKKNDEIFHDNGTSVKMRMQTGWMSFADIQNFKRVYRMEFLGAFYSAHQLKVQVAYDFNDIYVHSKTIDTADFIDISAYGEDTPYGSGSPYGGPGNVYQFRIDFQQQKCESIKIQIEDIQSGTELGRGAEWSNMNFVVGNKGSESKLNSNKKYGTS
jgi:hypothetical protein